LQQLKTNDEMKSESWKITLLLLGLSLPVCGPLFTTLQLSGHDALEYFPRLVEFHENIRHGILLPRWAPDLSAGYGQPFFLFNPPLLYYVAELWHLMGLDFVTALNATSITIVFGSAAAMYFLGKLYFGRAGGIIGAAAYVYAPYFHTNLYVRHALAEFMAFPFFPLTLFGLAAYARSKNKLFLIAAASGYAAILFSHNAAALLFTPVLVAFLLYNASRTKSVTVVGWQVGALLLGLGMAACVWVPILAEMDGVSVHRLLQGNLRYTNHFVYPKQLFSVAWGYGLSRPGDQDGMSFSLGWSHLVLGLSACLLALRWPERVDRSWLVFFPLATVALCALMVPSAQSFWDRLLLLQYVQFPWRLLALATLCLALTAAPLGSLINEAVRWRWLWISGAVAMIVLLNLSHARPEGFYDIDVAAWTPDEFARRGVAVTTREEFEPKWVMNRAPYRTNKIQVVSGDVRVLSINRGAAHLSANVTARDRSLLELGISYFPGWRVWLNGEEVDTRIAESTGLIRFLAPAGDHHIEARFTRTTPRWIGDGVSVFSTVLVFYLGWWCRSKNVSDALRVPPKKQSPPQKSRGTRRKSSPKGKRNT
jgi:hypothetical protein